MLYELLYSRLSLYPNLRACQVPKCREVDNGMKGMIGGHSHASILVW
jgi:hypothetical protein